MDVELRGVLRAHRAGTTNDEVVLTALARRGHSWANRREQFAIGMERVVEMLDLSYVVANPTAAHVLNHSYNADPFVIRRGSGAIVNRGWQSFACEQNAKASDGPRWVPTVRAIEPDHLSLEDETAFARARPDAVFLMRGRRVKVAVVIWHPSRLDMLESHDLDDVRMVVRTGKNDLIEAIESVVEAFPAATVTSWHATEGHRPQRVPPVVNDLDENMLPQEKQRVHVKRR